MTQPAFPVQLDGPRLLLRDFQPNDLDATMAIVGDPDVTVWLSFDTKTRDEQAERLAADIARAQANPRPDYYLAVVERQTAMLVGFARLGLGGHRSGEVGYAIRKDRWRQGYASEATATLLDFGFGVLGLHRIQAACGPQNFASQGLLPKLGFQYEGRMRDHVFTNGAWRDSLLYAVLEDEWRSHRSK